MQKLSVWDERVRVCRIPSRHPGPPPDSRDWPRSGDVLGCRLGISRTRTRLLWAESYGMGMTLREVPAPAAAAVSVLIRVHAAGLNP